jgi:uncharacterized protein (TIGR02453 family)
MNTPRFAGWGPEFTGFFAGLAAHNDKDWFDRHRDVYRTAVKEPAEALLAELEPRYGHGKMFRLNRDARFAAGRPPYHTNVSLEFPGDGVHHYLSASATQLMAAVGPFRADAAWVDGFRAAVAGRPGAALERIVGGLRVDGYEIGGDTLRTVPRGYPADHPRADLLRHRSLYAGRTWPPERWVGDRRAVDLVVEAWRGAGPLADWLRRHCPMGGS